MYVECQNIFTHFLINANSLKYDKNQSEYDINLKSTYNYYSFKKRHINDIVKMYAEHNNWTKESTRLVWKI